MPKLSAPQMLWTGVGLLLFGAVGGWIGQVVFIQYAYRASWAYGIGAAFGNGFVVVGAALIAGAFVVAAVQRGPVPQQQPGVGAPYGVPGAPYGGAAPYGAPGPQAPQQPQHPQPAPGAPSPYGQHPGDNPRP
jgi:hypothetical protein